MQKKDFLGRISLCALAAAAFLAVGPGAANAAGISTDQLQQELNSLQSQINALKAQQRALNEQAAQQAQVAKQQALVATQQEAAARNLASNRYYQIDKSNIPAGSSIEGPTLNNPSITFRTGSGGRPNLLALPQNVTVSLHGEFGAFAALSNGDANNVSGYKLNPLSGDAFATFAPAVDFGVSKSLHYGVKSVLWISQTGASTGANENETTAGIGTPSFVVHFGYGYIKSDKYGTLNMGQVPGTFTSMEVGNPNLDSGGWDRIFEGGLATVVPGDVRPYYLHGTTNALDATLKAVYISPEFYHFKFGMSFEPNADGIKQGDFTCAAAAATCATLSSSPSPSDIGKRRKNTIDATLEYENRFGAYSFVTSGGILYGSTIAYDGPPTTAIVNYLPLKVGRFGAEVRGPLGPGKFIVSGNTEFGNVVDQFAFQPKGAPDAFEYVVGLTYLIDRWKFAGSYFNNQTAGDYDPRVTGRYEVETGTGAEIAYSMTDHWKVMLSYLYGSRRQRGFNFITQSTGTAHNYVQTQTVGLGTQFEW